jgi:hypothetical protein
MASPCKCSDHPRRRRARRLAAWVMLAVPAWPAHAGPVAETGGVPQCAPPAPLGTTTRHVRLVTGVPYSALGTSETVTTRADGARIVRHNTIRMWRDSDGRTRSDISLTSIGGPPAVEINTRLTVIDDPTTRERYMLQPDGRVIVIPISPCRLLPADEPDLIGPPRPANLHLRVSAPVRLGERKVGGETVTGSRVEATIPAGAMGNERPVKMSAEQWYGKDLQVVVEATYRDPRTGETRYRLREILRDEPDAKLFRVPETRATPALPRSPR